MVQENPLYGEALKYKNMYEAERRIHEVRNKQLKDLQNSNYKYQQEYRTQKAMIDLMAEDIALQGGVLVWDNFIEELQQVNDREEIIEFYREKVKEYESKN